MGIEEAVASRRISEDQAAQFYGSLSGLLQDGDHGRLALYLPFESLPSRAWQPKSDQLTAQAETFRQTYLNAWYALLHTHSVRANFIDGDVLEESYRTGDIPRVVKAAHLIPGLLQRGILDELTVAGLQKWAVDPLLQQGIAEGMSAYRRGITTGSVRSSELAGRPIKSVIIEHQLTLDALLQQLPTDVSERRRTWLAQTEREAIVASAAGYIAAAIRAETSPDEAVMDITTGTAYAAQQMLIDGVRQAVTTAAMEDVEQARVLFDRYYPVLSSMFKSEDVETAERLAVLFRQCYHLGVIGRELVEQWDIELPNLAGPHSENLAGMQGDIERLQAITARVEADPELPRYLYPAVIIGGSRLKGYGQQSSDVDISVFIRPGVVESDRERIRTMLSGLCRGDDVTYEPTEFWLEDSSDGQLLVHDFPTPDMHTADSYWTHVLFSGAWVGSGRAVRELQQKLLPTYFRAAEGPRQLYLERLEQGLLQYRLMHKGYARHHPLRIPDLLNHPAIDGTSTFWDPGYRRIATRLFVNNVFLPKL